MHQERENLDILFRRTAPETVLNNIRTFGHFFNTSQLLQANTMDYTQNTYDHYSFQNLPEYSVDEVELRFRYLKNSIKQDENAGLFSLLYHYADRVLVMDGDVPLCRLESVLGWNSISKRLGQDLFITAWLAWKDREDGIMRRKGFVWPSVIGTDDRRLEAILNKGLAENHYHLHGSTQSFALSWACLMNHPECINDYFGRKGYFSENLNSSLSKGVSDNQMEWKERISYAAMIRALLFARCAGEIDRDWDEEEKRDGVWSFFKKFDCIPMISEIRQQVEPLRRIYGVYFSQTSDETIEKRCLDYANSNHFYQVEENAMNRLLAGERSFLYHCFRMHFNGEFTGQEASLLYMYILIKSQFRSELIQINKRTGFTNFGQYQDRKNQFFGELDEYWKESFRLSVGSAMEKKNMQSLEARIMPKDTAGEMKEEIEKLDVGIRLALKNKFDMPYYVIHFPKKKFSQDEFIKKEEFLLPRNCKVRENAKRKAKALVDYLQRFEREGARVYGIDACSLEIGCRPEVFATEFRYVRKYGIRRKYYVADADKGSKHKKIGVTYHVGEDFLDIIDGLRAIDEALEFLQMEKDDRLGHALALGIAPKEYYEMKRREIYLTKQDFLDNLVWILYRSLELNIVIDANHRAKMQGKARQLLREIYGNGKSEAGKGMLSRQPVEMLDMYYASWRLRGDHPDLYKSGGYKKVDSFDCLVDDYNTCMEGRKELQDDRQHEVIAEFYYLYHFDTEVKKAGLEPVNYNIEDWYVDLAGEFQKVFRMEIVKRGIAIECNPTSNVLIGTFGEYSKHPILSFNDYRLDEQSKNPHIQVSVNTDDLGVFDTSLENEYALLLCAICRERHKDGNYNDDAVYEYLDYLRENGLRMSFRREV